KGGFLSLSALFGGFACLFLVSLADAARPQFDVAEAAYRTLDDERRFDGVVQAVQRSTISAQTSGEIVELPYDVNDYVPKGAVVFRIDDTRQKAELEKAIANVTEAKARLEEARSRYARNRRLIKQNAVSRSELDKSAADLKSARAQLEQAQAAVKQAREQLEYTVVRAPYAGVVVERFVELGEQVQPGTRLGTGLSLENLRVEVDIPARYVQRIRTAARARVRKPGGGWLQAEKVTVFPYADPKSHSFTVRVQLPQGRHDMYPGILVKVAFKVGERHDLLIPARAIVHRSEVTGVYVIGPGQRIRFRQLLVGRDAPGGMKVVLAGLSAGERVALDPVAAGIALKQQASGPAHE
ncbi:MAG TPA: efflux RND transporter periplasmic adaptor subunit, partial [Gammaproteobacteria bacterium]|nr:efflux RND transporter periplasmic adaptor subunit [Gammaproteobacteria bacterium]